ncbi:MAG TPA: methionine biosynthesis protein MetW [Desulfocapsa sulfexigens]|nr:methionine biosynthesis protein MetW [Desulfocapsa sulfexigens]
MELKTPEKLRYDLVIIASWIKPGSRVLDLGCGRGDLLAWLKKHKNIQGTGIEQDKDKAAACISRGLTVLQGDLKDEVLDYPDGYFDVVILSQTLQQVLQPDRLLKSLARIGKQVIVSFPNFSHYSGRLQLFFKGTAPKTRQLPYSWYDTPNIRVITLADFRSFAKKVGYTIVKECAINSYGQDREGKIVTILSNLRATYGVFLIEKTKAASK